MIRIYLQGDKDTENFEEFFKSYIACALWADLPDDVDSGEYDQHDINRENLAAQTAECALFFLKYKHLFNDNYDQAGHDFYLTRCGHGAGFWDREDSVYAQKEYNVKDYLTRQCETFGNVDVSIHNREVIIE